MLCWASSKTFSHAFAYFAAVVEIKFIVSRDKIQVVKMLSLMEYNVGLAPNSLSFLQRQISRRDWWGLGCRRRTLTSCHLSFMISLRIEARLSSKQIFVSFPPGVHNWWLKFQITNSCRCPYHCLPKILLGTPPVQSSQSILVGSYNWRLKSRRVHSSCVAC